MKKNWKSIASKENFDLVLLGISALVFGKVMSGDVTNL